MEGGVVEDLVGTGAVELEVAGHVAVIDGGLHGHGSGGGHGDVFVNGVEEVTCFATRVLAGRARSRDDSSRLLNLGCFIPPFAALLGGGKDNSLVRTTQKDAPSAKSVWVICIRVPHVSWDLRHERLTPPSITNHLSPVGVSGVCNSKTTVREPSKFSRTSPTACRPRSITFSLSVRRDTRSDDFRALALRSLTHAARHRVG